MQAAKRATLLGRAVDGGEGRADSFSKCGGHDGLYPASLPATRAALMFIPFSALQTLLFFWSRASENWPHSRQKMRTSLAQCGVRPAEIRGGRVSPVPPLLPSLSFPSGPVN